ncbi:MAG: DUF4232 domain-containing protein [Jatrophihabitantaceae bacterium]
MKLAARSALAVLALLVAGCAAQSGPATPGPSAPTATNPSDSQPPVITESALPTGSSSTDVENPTDLVRPSTPAAASSPPSTDGLANCALPYLRVTVRAAAARSSHAGYLVSFTNTGQIACQLTGYPSVAVLAANGQPAVRASPTPYGYLGGVPSGKPVTVLIATGQQASALLEGEVIDINGNRCPGRPGLSITPPNSTLPARIPVGTAICGGVQIHPVVAGKSD